MATQFLKRHSNAQLSAKKDTDSIFRPRAVARRLSRLGLNHSEWWLSVDYAEFIDASANTARA
jgi:hypothetical protein